MTDLPLSKGYHWSGKRKKKEKRKKGKQKKAKEAGGEGPDVWNRVLYERGVSTEILI